jgi:hypothetical protein
MCYGVELAGAGWGWPAFAAWLRVLVSVVCRMSGQMTRFSFCVLGGLRTAELQFMCRGADELPAAERECAHEVCVADWCVSFMRCSG